VICFVQTVREGPVTLAAPPLFAVTVWIFAAEGGAVARLLNGRVFQKLGLWSYGIYMTHILLILTIDKLVGFAEKRVGLNISSVELHTHEGGLIRQYLIYSPWVMDVLAIVFLVAVAGTGALAYRYIEVPGQDLIRRIGVRRRLLEAVPVR
jgi:peptidoglycan/LPS O-acetylase OafA/YrhL